MNFGFERIAVHQIATLQTRQSLARGHRSLCSIETLQAAAFGHQLPSLPERHEEGRVLFFVRAAIPFTAGTAVDRDQHEGDAQQRNQKSTQPALTTMASHSFQILRAAMHGNGQRHARATRLKIEMRPPPAPLLKESSP